MFFVLRWEPETPDTGKNFRVGLLAMENIF